MKRALPLACATLAVALSACKGCREDHPYVPYAIDGGGVASAVGDSGAQPVAEGGAAFAGVPAVLPPPDTATWVLAGLKLEAPPASFFVLGLAHDLDGDGTPDVLAIVRARNPGSVGDVVFYKGRSAGGVDPGVAVTTTSSLSPDPSCAPTQRLEQVGKHSAFVELGEQCAGHASGPAPSRWAGVVSFGRGASIHFSLMIVDPPGAPALTLDADGSDSDGDGIDDVALRVTVEGGGPPFEPGPRASAIVRWLDRPAGMSREPDQPEASLHALAALAASRAAKAKDAPGVPLYVHQLRTLYAAICGEGGAPRLVRVLGGSRPIACGPTSRALEEAGMAEVRALASSGDVLGAIAAFDRAQLPPASRTASRTAEAQGWIVQAAPLLPAKSMRAIAAVPLIDHGHAPSWGALAFESSGKLLVRTLAGVARVDPALGDEAEAGDVTAWKPGVVSPDGAFRWIDAYDPCDASALHATFAPTAPADARDVAVPVQARLGTHCAGAKTEPAPATPVAWGPSGLEALVAGELVLFAPDLTRASSLAAPLAEPWTAGAPRSPDGKTMVVPTSLGLVVRGAPVRVYRARELDGAYLELRDCTVSDDTNRVACVRGGRAFVGIWN